MTFLVNKSRKRSRLRLKSKLPSSRIISKENNAIMMNSTSLLQLQSIFIDVCVLNVCVFFVVSSVCINGTFECTGRQCHANCSDDEFRCPGEDRCIPGGNKCDGIVDCRTGEDELGCRKLVSLFPSRPPDVVRELKVLSQVLTADRRLISDRNRNVERGNPLTSR
jgi:hypothetical protein